MTDELNNILIAVSDEFRRGFNGDPDTNTPVNVVIGDNFLPGDADYPMVVIQDLTATDEPRLLGDRILDGRGKMVTHSFQCDIIVDDEADIGVGHMQSSLARYMATNAVEIIERIYYDCATVFSGVGVSVTDINNTGFTNISFLLDGQVYQLTANIEISYVKTW